MSIPPQTEVEKQRAAWWAEHRKPGITFSEAVHLNDIVIQLYPPTSEEREQKTRDLEAMPEFTL
jgi:hypothetical protein